MKTPFDIAADLDTPVSAYLKLAPFRPRFLLESVEGGERLARYSFIGFGDCLEVRLDAAGLTVGGTRSPRPASRLEFLNALRGALAQAPKPRPEVPDVPLLGGLVGYTAYDAVRYFERVTGRSLDATETPHAHYVAPRSLLVFDHLTRSVALLHDGTEAERQSLRREVIRALRGAVPTMLAPGRFSPATPSLNQEAHAVRVRRAQEYIRAGDIYQANLSQRLFAAWPLSGWALFQRLSAVSPAPFSAYLDCDDFQIASSSPELFLRLSGQQIHTRPIKGTRPRSADPTRDAQLTYELQTSAKEMAELVMITDLLRNDLGKVCEFGSVQVPELVRLERYPQVQHLVSTVEGRLRREATHFSAFASCFPGGSITGAPKFRAMEIIDELERVSRGPYTGALGYLGFNRESQLSILIRAAICKDRVAYFHTGAGIVADSDPRAEYEETLAKARGFLQALNLPAVAEIGSANYDCSRHAD